MRWCCLLLSLLLFACGGQGAESTSSEGDGRVSVVTTLAIFADLVRNVGGDRVEVQALLPPGADAHTYELPPDRVAALARADVVFVNGLDLEGNVLDAIEANARGPVVKLSEGLEVRAGGTEHKGEEEDERAESNPHLWLDVANAQRYVERIRDALIEIDPEGREKYDTNATAYLEELEMLDAAFESAVASIPEERRKLVTFHDAFPYLARRYGLEVVAVVVPSPGQEPSARAVADLTRTLRDEGVPAVFAEPQFDNAILEEAAHEANVEVRDLLSDVYTEGVDSYIELMEFNMRQLQEGLGDD